MIIIVCFVIVILINIYYIIVVKYNFNQLQKIQLDLAKNQLEITMYLEIMTNQIKELEKAKK